MSQPLLNNRREWLKLSALLSAGGALPLLQSFEARAAADAEAPVRIGYLPITDATPLLVAHHNKLYEAQGLQVEPPRMFRSWSRPSSPARSTSCTCCRRSRSGRAMAARCRPRLSPGTMSADRR